jgi:hypothetical protein
VLASGLRVIEAVVVNRVQADCPGSGLDRLRLGLWLWCSKQTLLSLVSHHFVSPPQLKISVSPRHLVHSNCGTLEESLVDGLRWIRYHP